MTKILVRAAAVTLLATVALMAGGTSPASAAQLRVEQQVAGLLKHNPGAHRLDATSVEIADGVVVTVPAAGAKLTGKAAADIPLVCAVGWSCYWEHSFFHGERISFYTCNSRDLSKLYMSSGRPWNDQISSVGNNQQFSSVLLYNWVGRWDLKMMVPPRDSRIDLELAFLNDMIDQVDPC